MRSRKNCKIFRWIIGSLVLLMVVAGSFAAFFYFPRDSSRNRTISKHVQLSPCPLNAGKCLGIHKGDIDGDGTVDEVGVTNVTNSDQVVVFAVLATGKVLKASFSINHMVEDISNVSFLGLTNMDGVGRDQIFIYYRGCSSGCGFVHTFELRNNRLQPMSFQGGGPGLFMDDSGVKAGFTCRIVNGIHEVVTLIGQNGIDSNGPVYEYVYQADRSGNMHVINERYIIYTSKQIEAVVGAHCLGLHTW